MSFQDLKKVETADTYIDIAFRRGKIRATYMRQKKFSKDRVARSKQIELVRIEAVKDQLVTRLRKVIENFPNYDELHEFYQELMTCTMEYTLWRKNLAALNWAAKQITILWRSFTTKLRRCHELEPINNLRKQYYGRVASVMKQINKNLESLDEQRRIMRRFPVIKTGMPTVVIAGFPNVGKTTLLAKLTGAKAEIQPYAFTTKRLNIGYITKKAKRERIVQFIDAPGTLNRFNKMNMIEKQAYLALEYLAEKVIYVFDPTESYPMDQQVTLYKKMKKDFPKIPFIAYLSKTDLVKNYKGDAMQFKPLKSITKIKAKVVPK